MQQRATGIGFKPRPLLKGLNEPTLCKYLVFNSGNEIFKPNVLETTKKYITYKPKGEKRGDVLFLQYNSE